MLAPLARIPAVIPGSFTLMGTLAVLTALIVQSGLLASENVSVGSSLIVSLLALVFGLIGAKLWYAVLHPGAWRQSLGGWSVDGFLVVAPAVSVAALLAFDLPIGAFLDAAAPGIFFAVAIGRFGCFFTGCCAGRWTRSRWGVWSSDRHVGARRIPAQLLESAAGLIISLASAMLVLANVFGVSGLVFVVAVVAYFLVRQVLLRLRAERREYSWRRSGLVSRERS
jgi:Prolipoprotein diacylglyceryltransferase